MRPVLAVDATYLRGRTRGCMFVAACMDGNGQIYPVAFGFGPGETHEAYTWFFGRLKEVIGEPNDLMFITDRHVAIRSALMSVYPNVPHGLCIFHIVTNIKAKKFPQKEFVSAMFTKAAKAYTVNEFDMLMRQLNDISPTAAQYIQQVDPIRWARCHSPVRRYSLMTTNIAESMNAVLKEARKKTIVPLIEDIRSLLQKWFYERHTVASTMNGPVTVWLEKELTMRMKTAIRLKVYPVNINVLMVVGPGTNESVDLNAKTCSCKEFDLDQYPCAHALAACPERNVSYYSMCLRYYKAMTLITAYANLYPVDDRQRWSIP